MPRDRPRGPVPVRARSLRTQQRAESQCRWLCPGPGCLCSGSGLFWLLISRALVRGSRPGFEFIYGEFDPGSGRTLAACLTHASRTGPRLRVGSSGEWVSNTWVTCPWLWDNSKKLGLIPDIHCWPHGLVVERVSGWGWARGLSACWWGSGLPRRRRVAGLRG